MCRYEEKFCGGLRAGCCRRSSGSGRLQRAAARLCACCLFRTRRQHSSEPHAERPLTPMQFVGVCMGVSEEGVSDEAMLVRSDGNVQPPPRLRAWHAGRRSRCELSVVRMIT